jgi:hypothetical protein
VVQFAAKLQTVAIWHSNLQYYQIEPFLGGLRRPIHNCIGNLNGQSKGREEMAKMFTRSCVAVDNQCPGRLRHSLP